MDVDPRQPFGQDEDDEPERRLPARTPPPPKKPLDVFLAEFERRLAEQPDQPATDAHLELEARAEGARRPPMGSRRPGAPVREVVAEAITRPEPIAADVTAPAEPVPLQPDETTPAAPPDGPAPTAEVPTEPEVAGDHTTNPPGGDQEPPAVDAPAAPATPAAGNARRRPRGRRHRRRRH